MIPTAGPSVSVLVCTRNRPVLLERCLRSVLACDPPPVEVLVVDQSTDDSSRRLVEGLGSPLVRHVDDRGRGLSVAQNLGLRHCTGDVVLVTDDDCVVPPEWVGAAAAAFNDDGALGLLGGRVLPLGEPSAERVAVSTRTSEVPLLLDNRSRPWDVGSGNNFALRRTRALAIGGNDERLGPGAVLLGGADMDLFRRVLRSGALGRYDPAVVVLHELATVGERMDRRVPYGLGMGACLSLWARQGDRRAVALGAAWFGMRLRRLLGAVRQRDPLRAREELLILAGTLRGIALALRGEPGPVSSLLTEPVQ